MRVLVVTNFLPDHSAPQRGRWVTDQIEELRERGVEIQEFAFPRGRSHYLPATRGLRRALRRQRFDIVHAHYGLAGWCAQLAGAKPLVVTFHGTDVRHRVVGPLSRILAQRATLCAGVSRALFAAEDGRPGLPRVPGAAVLPCGADLERFGPRPRSRSRAELGLDPEGRYLFFPADPSRPEKRHDRAAAVARACGAKLLSGGAIDPEQMAVWINAANAVLVTSEYEGFGLAAVEALACDVPVLSTPVGIAPYALGGIEGCLCAPYEVESWSATAAAHLAVSEPRIEGFARASSLSASRMAERVLAAYRDVLAGTVID